MSRKFITGIMLFMTLGFLLLGFIFKSAADQHKGLEASAGVIINGEYKETAKGRLGTNTEKYEAFNAGGTIFYILGGITGVICIISILSRKKNNY